MARRTTSSRQSVSLFPFLAVLVCVMGALIFLLLATTKRLRDVALAEAEADRRAAHPPLIESPPPATDLDAPEVPLPRPDLGTPTASIDIDMVDAVPRELPDLEAEHQRERQEQEWRGRLAALEAQRDRLAESLRQQQRTNQTAKGALRELEESVAFEETRLRGLLASLNNRPENEVTDADLAALEVEIIALRKELRSLRNRPAPGKTKFAVIPFDVRSGTTRRPILIECTDTGLRFLSEDVVVRPSDLQGFTEKYNPLLAGAGALVNYWTWRNQQQEHPDDEPEPYVLLVVRPSGTVAYYVAMRMLSSLKQPFGYELVDESVTLEPPPADPAAKRACEEAVARLLAERSDLMAPSRDAFRAGRRHSSSPNAFEVADVLPSSAAVGERSWENIERFEGRPRTRRGGEAPKPPGENRPAPRRDDTSPASVDSATPEIARRGAKTASTPPPSSTRSPTPELEPGRAAPSQTARQLQRPTRSEQKPFAAAKGREPNLEQLARRRWGQSEPGASIGIEQDVTIRIDAQQLVVADDRVVRVAPGEAPLDVFLRMMEAVDAEAQTWGRPRPGFYWTPRLRFIISPGGNQLFERIDPLTARSGLSATREFTLEGIHPVVEEIAP